MGPGRGQDLGLQVIERIGGSSLLARIARGSALTTLGFIASNAIRLAANLVLARLLFPEAFGLIALVTVLLVGLTMFSDIGITPGIQRSKRGDEPDFLNTAWTLQIIRSVILFAVACALAWPMAQFYDEPSLLQLVPAAAISLLILAAQPTRMETAQRHMLLGRLTLLELISQILSVLVMVVLAWAWGSVWALVVGNLVAAALRVVLGWTLLPGIVNRLRLERSAIRELITFGKWIFLSTVAGFAMLHGDKLVLGRVLDSAGLGIYNIGYFLAGFPLLLGQALIGRMMIPIYRENPPAESAANYNRLRRLRFGLSLLLLFFAAPLALGGFWLVGLLYDARYAASAAVLVVISVALLPQLLVLSYDQAALAAGDSQSFFVLTAVRASLLMTLLLLLAPAHGVAGAALAIGLSSLLSYPLVVRLARKHGAWDGLHDLVLGSAALALGALALWLHGPALGALPGFGGMAPGN